MIPRSDIEEYNDAVIMAGSRDPNRIKIADKINIEYIIGSD